MNIPRRSFVVIAVSSLSLICLFSTVHGGPPKLLRIGTSGYLTPADQSGTAKAALDALGGLIQDETSLQVRIDRQNGWRTLAQQMAKGQLELGIFQGYEFAWATENNEHLKPLVLANNGNRYPVLSIMTRRDNPAKDFAGLEGQSISIPDIGQRDLRLFIHRRCQVLGKHPETFFSRISTPHNVEEALDDLVDGQVQAVVVDQPILEAYRRRKPGRFDQLKEVLRSKPFPPVVFAYDDRVLDEATARQVRDGLLRGNAGEKRDLVLGLLHWKSFEPVPGDFNQVLADTRKAYPPNPSPAR